MITLPNLKFLIKHPSHFLALGFGAGLSKKAPGTLGTLVGIPIYLLISSYSFSIQMMMALLFTIVGIFICNQTAQALKVKDPSAIVWDEISAFFLMLVIAHPLLNPLKIFELFVLFRIFDIWKPFPINYLDKHVGGGLGIMLDDYVAAFFALLIYFSIQ
ncbi:phosphatidylglycerophosphatase A [Candidatus Methylopumilus planktonicus]|nr:phosphatidylglycerophosphatase A [Candidatus Methylopumilus planktonicus]QDD02000.1 phosphatidylglycerophosphatase A [Candidatus Methylopumilus planktonicus]QDD07264.1 phosphatidylglycerophosphatase A [Candidatus Methylopumilus planktonicus]QDD08593.1 phosphatidylglycerophosphatase A [Candidatus Methylopumilus planktonicus]QDD09916.1 phosphatidylglycerophosphatase A [Candidatus Methylopumilus planktonicus]